MSSVRDFCRDGQFETVLALTYSFDPRFFERVALRDLEAGGARRILIITDHTEGREAVRRCAHELEHIGRSYQVATAHPARTFHPKLIARLAPARGRAWVGSGNLTYTGWGGNYELGVGWDIGPDCEDDGTWLFRLLTALPELVPSKPARWEIAKILSEISWLQDRPGSRAQALSNVSATLSSQLSSRWAGRRFDTLKLCTGSSDVDAAFLRWACKMFGLKHIDICVTPHRVSFSTAALARLPAKVRVFVAKPPRLMHAKFFWFTGPDGASAIAGSANCSAAAWLSNGANANIELVTIYDDAPKRQFADALSVFSGAGHAPGEIAFGAPAPGGQEVHTAPPYWLTSVALTSHDTIEADISPLLPPDAIVDLVVKEEAVRAFLSRETYVARLAREFTDEISTFLVSARILLPSGVQYDTEPLWADHVADLQRARETRAQASYDDLLDLHRFGDRRERFVNAIRSVSFDLRLSKNVGSRPVGVHTNEIAPAPGRDSTPAQPTDPDELIRSLYEHGASTTRARKLHHSGVSSVLRALFGPDQEEPPNEENAPTQHRQHIPRGPTPQVGDPEIREVLADFLAALKRPSFADTCSPEQAAQALMFPILICTIGVDEGWLPEADLSQCAATIVNVMCEHVYDKQKERGLLSLLFDRCTSEPDNATEFDLFVADGTLLCVLLAALAKGSPASVPVAVQRAAALDKLRKSPLLTRNVDMDRLAGLIKRLRITDAPALITTHVPRITEALRQLSAALKDLPVGQNFHRAKRYPAQSVLWSPSNWIITPALPAESYHCGCRDLVAEARQHRVIAERLGYLLSSMRDDPALDSGA